MRWLLGGGTMKRIATLISFVLVGCTETVPVNERCATSADCTNGLVCLDGRCSACTSDAQCGEGVRCGAIGAGRCGCLDQDGDGVTCADCDDADATRFPEAVEICDGKDNDCDGTADEGVVPTWFADQDGDGFGQPMLAVQRCAAPNGFVSRGGDCNDADPATYPERAEVCDGRDNDCDGEFDEGVRTTWYRDTDGDGYGDPNNSVSTCQPPGSGFVSLGTDCDDSRADANPNAAETCNARDDDCDGAIDDFTRTCANACGAGNERCTAGLWGACDAPLITEIHSAQTLTGTTASYECLLVSSGGTLTIPADMTLTASNWIRAEANGQLIVGPRVQLNAATEISFTDQAVLLASDATLRAGTAVRVAQGARWFAQVTEAAAYSGGGSAACASPTVPGVGGASGGARGGSGGRGGACQPLITQPQTGAGGPNAINGTNGCDCPCNAATLTTSSAGGGGAVLAGGGGGGNAGAGGAGAPGFENNASTTAGTAGAAEPSALYGGGGGGSSGALLVPFAPEACQGAGGAGGGIVRVFSAAFSNRGILLADGLAGRTPQGGQAHAGGGGGGAGGTWDFVVERFENLASISAIGGRGGNGIGGGTTTRAGGGGGGGGGRILVSALSGSPTIVSRGNLFVGGGAGGTGLGGNGGAGGNGVIVAPP